MARELELLLHLSHSNYRVLQEEPDLLFVHRKRFFAQCIKQDLILMLNASVALAHSVRGDLRCATIRLDLDLM